MNSAALSPRFVGRLSKVLARLGSNFDAERATAGAMAHRMIRDAGLDWPDLISCGPARPMFRDRDCERLADLLGCEALTDWEYSFVSDVARRGRHLTDKQRAVVERIVLRVWAAA